MKKSHIALTIIVLIIIVGYFAFRSKPEVEENKVMENTSAQGAENTDATQNTPLVDINAGQVKTEVEVSTPQTVTFDISGGNYFFSPSTMKVKKGDTVIINFKNDGGMHDLKIDEYNVATPKLSSGATATVSFVADKSGTFEYYCSIGNHRAMGMKGTLIVE